MEFQRWWVLKRKIFGQKSTYSKKIIVFILWVQWITVRHSTKISRLTLKVKVHIPWEGHIILRNLHLTFDWHYLALLKTKVRWRFRKILRPSQNIRTLIFNLKNHPNFLGTYFFSIKNSNLLGAQFLSEYFFDSVWHPLFSKIIPNFWQTFYQIYPKFCFWNSTTEIIFMCMYTIM